MGLAVENEEPCRLDGEPARLAGEDHARRGPERFARCVSPIVARTGGLYVLHDGRAWSVTPPGCAIEDSDGAADATLPRVPARCRAR